MKKSFIFVISIIIILLVIALSKYYEYKEECIEIKKSNSQYEEYLNKEIHGTEIATIINKAVDDNEKNNVKKDKKGKYIPNSENYVNIEIKIIDFEEEKIYPMETLYNGGMNEFVQYYDTILFKCSKVEYNSQKKVNYMLFEQIST